ncbi:MAG: peptidoglycan-binding domain-containing protein [Pyrinomonadaceae bacterium]
MYRKILLILSVIFVTGIFAAAQTPTPTPAAPATAAATEKPARATIFRPTKDQVMQVQKILKEKKLYAGEAPGTYNDETRAGIKSFQKDNGLKETGTLNRATLEKFGVELTDKQKLIPVSPNSFADPATDSSPAKTATAGTDGVKGKTTTASASGSSTALVGATAAASSDAPKRPAPFQANKSQITDLQKVLIAAKMFAGEANGERSDALKDAVKKYQEANGLKATGGINAATLEKAGITLTDKQKEQVAAQAAYDAAKKN